jgi:hypothetical protein
MADTGDDRLYHSEEDSESCMRVDSDTDVDEVEERGEHDDETCSSLRKSLPFAQGPSKTLFRGDSDNSMVNTIIDHADQARSFLRFAPEPSITLFRSDSVHSGGDKVDCATDDDEDADTAANFLHNPSLSIGGDNAHHMRTPHESKWKRTYPATADTRSDPKKASRRSPGDITNLFQTPATPGRDSLGCTAKGRLYSPCSPPGTTTSRTGYSTQSVMKTHLIATSRIDSDFEVLDFIGTGTFGSVHKAKGRLDDICYAIKRSGRQFRNERDRSQMMAEVHALAALSASEDVDATSTIVRYYSAWIEDDYVYIQMELCETSLDALISNSRRSLSAFPSKDVYHVLRDCLKALSVLHKNDFVHLDVKPANILLKNGKFKLSDFGLALHTDKGKACSGEIEEGDSRYTSTYLYV